ncbi:Uncharacterised protein [Mycobacteroides abscessus subsp. abscessus]|nr:Uncharacterised protein [Mycobacteroides abscessus subsp. abscessus]
MNGDKHMPHAESAAHPLAHPPASTIKPPLTSTDDSGSAPNNGAHPATIGSQRRRQPRVEQRHLDAIAGSLSPRDWSIIRLIAEHRFMTVRQVESLCFSQHSQTSGSRIARRTLARLRGYQLLGTLSQRVGGHRSGSDGLVHYVAAPGLRLLDVPSGRHGGFTEPSARFLAHRLAITDARIALIEADRVAAVELITSAVEPAAWRKYVGIGAARRALKPDLTAETATGDWVHAWFIEIDLGSESIPTLLTKCRQYEAYRKSGIEQEQHGSFPVVIWSMAHRDPATATRRRAALAAAIAADRSLPAALFRIVAPDELVALIEHGGDQ